MTMFRATCKIALNLTTRGLTKNIRMAEIQKIAENNKRAESLVASIKDEVCLDINLKHIINGTI